MTSYFFDSSTIVKRYHWETGSGWVRAICGGKSHPSLYLSELSRVEVVGALRRTGRLEGLHSCYVDAMKNAFDRHLALSDPSRRHPEHTLVPISSAVLLVAESLCDKYAPLEERPIRSLDAIQLASTLLVIPNFTDELIFVTADTRLATIAEEEGLSVVNSSFLPQP